MLLKNHVKNGFGEQNVDDNEGGGDCQMVLMTMLMLDLQQWNSPNEEEEKSRVDIRLNLQS